MREAVIRDPVAAYDRIAASYSQIVARRTAYLDAIDYTRVVEVHLAGHRTLDDGLRLDTHDRPVCDAVWSLYAHAWRRGGPFPTMLERDDAIPAVEVLVDELRRARSERA